MRGAVWTRGTFWGCLLWVSLGIHDLSQAQARRGPPAGGSLPAGYDCTLEDRYATVEDLFGPGNVTAVSGNGRLTAGFGYAGELTVFRWPSPSYHDQIRYLTPIPLLRTGCASACECRRLPRNGAGEAMGSFAGVFLERGSGRGEVSWFRDPLWLHSQRYLDTGSNVLVTRAENPSLGLGVETLDFVHPELDVLVRHYRITSGGGAVGRGLMRVVYYENMEPVTRKTPYLPLDDWALESLYDGAVMYYSAGDALLHFRPQVPSASLLPSPGSDQGEIDRFIERLDDVFPFEETSPETPVYIAIGADFSGLGGGGGGRSDAHQCGLERLKAPSDASTRRLQSAFYDSLDGRLHGASVARGNVDGALMKEVSVQGGPASFTVYLAAAATARGALGLLEEARARGWERLLEETESEWSSWIEGARMPNTQDPDILAVCKRALVSIRQGQDARTGAFVASAASQPPYHLTWPRDGAFLSYAMDVAGFSGLAEKNLHFLARVQRDCRNPEGARYDVFCAGEPFFQRPLGWRFDGTYDMAYYADGTPGGPLFFEIDNSAFAAWAMWEHSRFLDEVWARAYLCGDPGAPEKRGLYEAIKRTASSLADCRQPGDEGGLQCFAFEDDNVELSRTLTGAVSVYMALEAAIQTGRVCGEDPGTIASWEVRRGEIGRAIETHFWDEGEGRYLGGSSAYLLWPGRIPIDAGRLRRHCSHLFSEVRAALNKETAVSAYVGKAILGLVEVGWGAQGRGPDLEWAVETLLKDVPAPGTLHYGEIFFSVDTDGDGTEEFSNRVAVPHVWEAALAYLVAIAYYGPRESQGGQEVSETPGGGCMCSLRPPGSGAARLRGGQGLDLIVALIPAGMIGWMRRRSRSTKPTRPPRTPKTSHRTPTTDVGNQSFHQNVIVCTCSHDKPAVES